MTQEEYTKKMTSYYNAKAKGQPLPRIEKNYETGKPMSLSEINKENPKYWSRENIRIRILEGR